MQLPSAASTATISLSDGSECALSDVLADFMKAMPKVVDFSEKGASGDEGKNDAKTRCAASKTTLAS